MQIMSNALKWLKNWPPTNLIHAKSDLGEGYVTICQIIWKLLQYQYNKGQSGVSAPEGCGNTKVDLKAVSKHFHLAINSSDLAGHSIFEI
jgi:hypothetical protein